MLRLFALGRCLPVFTRGQYHEALRERHAPLVSRCAAFRQWCHHYHQNHIQGPVDQAGGPLTVGPARFDNCSEFWFDDVAAIVSTFNDPSYLEGVRPDEKNWTDAASRVAFVAEEARNHVFGDAAARVKLLSLTNTGDTAPTQDAAGDAHCLRRSENPVMGVLDFARSCMAEDVTPPFSHVSERWFESAGALVRWLEMPRDVKSFSRQQHLWALEHVIF